MSDDRNLDFYYTAMGQLQTSDAALNKIIQSVEEQTGSKIISAMPAVTFEGTDPDTKVYLLLLTIYGDDNDKSDYTSREWMIMTGRQAVYDQLKMMVRNEAIDPNQSFVISGDPEDDEVKNRTDVEFSSKPITVYRFLKVMLESHKVLDDREDFDIDEYDPVDYIHGDKTILEI